MILLCTWTRDGLLVMTGPVSGKRYEFHAGKQYSVPADIDLEDVDQLLEKTFPVGSCRCNGKKVPEAVLQDNHYFSLLNKE